MRQPLSLRLVFVFSVLLSATAFAQGVSGEKFRKSTRTDAKGRPITVVDFEDAKIEGSAKSPDGFVLQSRSNSNFRNIIELRRNFRPQIQSSDASALMIK